MRGIISYRVTYPVSGDETSYASGVNIEVISQGLVESQLAGFVTQRIGGYIRFLQFKEKQLCLGLQF